MRDAGVHVLGGELLHQSANLLLCPPREVVTAARTPTAQGGAAGKVQLDSAHHHTTGVTCRLWSVLMKCMYVSFIGSRLTSKFSRQFLSTAPSLGPKVNPPVIMKGCDRLPPIMEGLREV